MLELLAPAGSMESLRSDSYTHMGYIARNEEEPMEQKTDLRIQKTYRALTLAFFQMLGEMRFEDIRVSELCERAMIRKSTFYKHFGDKYELLAFIVRQEQEKFNAASDPVQLNIRISKAIEDGDIVGRQALEKAGCTFYELPQEERQRWIQAIAPLHEAWISDVVKRGACTEEEARALLKDTLDTAKAIYEKQAD